MSCNGELQAEMPDDDDFELDEEMLAAIAAAEAAVGAMADDYPALLMQDAAALEDAAQRLAAFAPGESGHAQAAGEAFGILHNIKGQAASFGFGPATLLSDPLCESLRQVDEVSPVLVAHLHTAVGLLSRMADEGVTPQIDGEVEALISALPQTA